MDKSRGVSVNVSKTNLEKARIDKARELFSCLLRATGDDRHPYIPPLERNGRVVPDYVDALLKAYKNIRALKTNPLLYFTAQLKSFKRKGSFFSPQYLFGKGAVKRYKNWVSYTRARFNRDDIETVPTTKTQVSVKRVKADQKRFLRAMEMFKDAEVALCIDFGMYSKEFIIMKIYELQKDDPESVERIIANIAAINPEGVLEYIKIISNHAKVIGGVANTERNETPQGA